MELMRDVRKHKNSNQQIGSLTALFRLDKESTLSLQKQIRVCIINGIHSGLFIQGQRIPSSRKLAAQLNVSRNTVSLAYEQLIIQGHLVTQNRSGFYVAPQELATIDPARIKNSMGGRTREKATVKIIPNLTKDNGFICPPNWQKYRYPFIDGMYDKSLFPIVEWREASRLALNASEVEAWASDNGEADDEFLIEEIRTKLLPRRGIDARADEILITVGEQQAMHLVTELFAGPQSTVGLEEPGLPSMRQLVAMREANTHFFRVDDEGIVLDSKKLSRCDLVHITPSRQRPSGVTLSMPRRAKLLKLAKKNNFIIVEDDFECEMNYLGEALPALRSLAGGDQVVYVASLSKLLAPGVRLGFMVAHPDIIKAARHFRSLTTRRPSPNNQRTVAFFLSLGYYDTMLRRLLSVCEERLLALRDALDYYLPGNIVIPPVKGGTTYWVKCPKGLNTNKLVTLAESFGILIEPTDGYFAKPSKGMASFRLGITSISVGRIRDGIKALSEIIKQVEEPNSKPLKEKQQFLTADQLAKTIPELSFLYTTVYGDPCTIKLHKDGSMTGYSGYANEDRDTGHWWIDEDMWFRKWDHWSYGEALGFYVFVDDARMHWYNSSGKLIDSAHIIE